MHSFIHATRNRAGSACTFLLLSPDRRDGDSGLLRRQNTFLLLLWRELLNTLQREHLLESLHQRWRPHRLGSTPFSERVVRSSFYVSLRVELVPHPVLGRDRIPRRIQPRGHPSCVIERSSKRVGRVDPDVCRERLAGVRAQGPAEVPEPDHAHGDVRELLLGDAGDDGGASVVAAALEL